MEDKVVAVVDADGKALSEKHTAVCRFRNFELLPHDRGTSIMSPPFTCHGHSWKVKVVPGGDTNSDKTQVNVSVYLVCCDNIDIDAQFSLRMDSANRKKTTTHQFSSTLGKTWGWPDFLQRTVLLRNLTGGTLELKVDIQVYRDVPSMWTPTNSLQLDWLRFMRSEKKPDVIFSVGRKKFAAHGFALQLRAPFLASLVDEDAIGGKAIPLSDVDPTMFGALLHFTHYDKLPSTVNLKKDAKPLLELANKFSFTSLKLVAEAELAASGITVENAADMALWADGMSCGLLYEAAIEFIARNREGVMQSTGYPKLEESTKIMADILRALSKRTPSGNDDTNIEDMNVATLRKRLEEQGLDVDGTREMLVMRLKSCKLN